MWGRGGGLSKPVPGAHPHSQGSGLNPDRDGLGEGWGGGGHQVPQQTRVNKIQLDCLFLRTPEVRPNNKFAGMFVKRTTLTNGECQVAKMLPTWQALLPQWARPRGGGGGVLQLYIQPQPCSGMTQCTPLSRTSVSG